MMNEETYKDAFNLLCGDKLGEGCYRTVFACKLKPDLVVKVENDNSRGFANVFEQYFWDDNKYDKTIAKWLAPCEYLSPDGRILLQKRCDPVPSHFKVPAKIPHFLTDLKLSNFGLLNGKFVCVDYAMVVNNPSSRLVKREFW